MAYSLGANLWLTHQLQARIFMLELENWKQSLGETGEMHFAMISKMYSHLLDIVPSDTPMFRAALDSYIELLRNSTLKRDNPPVWLMRVGALINKGFVDAQASDLALIRAWIRKRGDGTMAALAECIAPDGVDSAVGVS